MVIIDCIDHDKLAKTNEDTVAKQEKIKIKNTHNFYKK
jgi:hypothetical protein